MLFDYQSCTVINSGDAIEHAFCWASFVHQHLSWSKLKLFMTVDLCIKITNDRTNADAAYIHFHSSQSFFHKNSLLTGVVLQLFVPCFFQQVCHRTAFPHSASNSACTIVDSYSQGSIFIIVSSQGSARTLVMWVFVHLQDWKQMRAY